MDFDKMLARRVEMIDVPDELSPENMAKKLKELSPKMEREHRTALGRGSIVSSVGGRSTASGRKSAIVRTVTAAAALAGLAAGFVAFVDKTAQPAELESEIVYKDVEQLNSYDDLYSIYTQIYLDGNGYSDNVGAGNNSAYVTESDMDISSDLLQNSGNIVCSGDGTVYVYRNGKVYTANTEGLKVCIESAAADAEKMYYKDGRLVLISQQPEIAGLSVNDSTDTVYRTDTFVYIYDVSGETSVLVNEFTQSGKFISSGITADGKLYIAADYSGYRKKPLGQEDDLDNYVPYYLIGTEKHYVAAEDIIVPANAQTTDYTVLSLIGISDGSISAKAVLGTDRKVYVSDNTLYTAGVVKADESYTTVTSFDITNGLAYKASGSVEGVVTRADRMNEYDGLFRIATTSYGVDSSASTNIFVLDDTLSAVRTAGRLLPESEVVRVSFESRYALLETGISDEPELIVDLDAQPPVVAENLMNDKVSSLTEYGDSFVLGIGRTDNGDVSLTMYDSADGVQLDKTVIENTADMICDAVTENDLIFADPEAGLVGIPTASVDDFGVTAGYYLYSYDRADGFKFIGSTEHTDIDFSCEYRSAVVSDGVLYVVSDSGITAVNVSDMSVADRYDF